MKLSFSLLAFAIPSGVSAASQGTRGLYEQYSSFIDRICTCHPYDKKYVVNDEPRKFADHQAIALTQGCILATISSEHERDQILEALTDKLGTDSVPDASHGEELAWLGFLRPTQGTETPGSTATSGTNADGWVWLDGCTPPRFGQDCGADFLGNEPDNAVPPEYLGGIWYADNSDGDGDKGSLADISDDFVLPAVYECCDYHPW